MPLSSKSSPCLIKLFLSLAPVLVVTSLPSHLLSLLILQISTHIFTFNHSFPLFLLGSCHTEWLWTLQKFHVSSSCKSSVCIFLSFWNPLSLILTCPTHLVSPSHLLGLVFTPQVSCTFFYYIWNFIHYSMQCHVLDRDGIYLLFFPLTSWALSLGITEIIPISLIFLFPQSPAHVYLIIASQ